MLRGTRSKKEPIFRGNLFDDMDQEKMVPTSDNYRVVDGTTIKIASRSRGRNERRDSVLIRAICLSCEKEFDIHPMLIPRTLDAGEIPTFTCNNCITRK